MMTRNPSDTAIGMAWYRPETFDEVRALMTDRHLYKLNYEKWRFGALKAEDKYRRQGYVVIRAYLDPDTFPAFCRSRNLEINAAAQVEFARHKALQAIEAISRPF